MDNPYDDILGNDRKKKNQSDDSKLTSTESSESELSSDDLPQEDAFKTDNKEPLDEIADNIQLFNGKATAFAELLSNTKAAENKVTNIIERFLFVNNSPNKKPNLFDEREYHLSLKQKFTDIIVPMRALAQIHKAIVRQFNKDIDDNYFSVEKTDHNVKSEKSMVVHNINIQRKILGDGANDLIILKNALALSEERLKEYINAGGINNISSAECEIIIQDRMTLTSGQDHKFSYAIFEINVLDKTAISLGIYMQQTSAQYFGKLMKVFG